MKRLNPETGKPFVRNDVDLNGRIFWHYRLDKKDNNGNFKELWCDKATIQIKKISHRLSVKKFTKTKLSKAKQLIKGAKQRGNVSVSLEWVEAKLEKGICELSGIPFVFINTTNYSKNPYSPSLDRIDSSNPEYSPENTRLVLTCINQALNQYGLEHFLKVAQAVIDYQKDK